MAWKCPICGSDVIAYYADYIEGSLMESADRCTGPDVCYESEFHYGYHRERIGGCSWEWSHNESVQDSARRDAERRTAIDYYKTRYGRLRGKVKVSPPCWQRYGF